MTDTGGAAFPQIAELGDIGYRTSGGMTKREYFAGQALAGMLANCNQDGESTWQFDHAAKMAVVAADHLIAALGEKS